MNLCVKCQTYSANILLLMLWWLMTYIAMKSVNLVVLGMTLTHITFIGYGKKIQSMTKAKGLLMWMSSIKRFVFSIILLLVVSLEILAFIDMSAQCQGALKRVTLHTCIPGQLGTQLIQHPVLFETKQKIVPPMQAQSSVWARELAGDIDECYLMNGVLNGFKIVDVSTEPIPVVCDNYRSTKEHAEKVEKQILYEIEKGNYVVCEEIPTVVSSLGAIPKPGTEDVRLIHDLTRGHVNELATETSVQYPSIEDATKLMPPNAWLAKLDLKSAYRSVHIHDSCFHLTGLQWLFKNRAVTTYLKDVRLPFGASKSCHIFQRLSDSITRMMARRGFITVGYLDDFLVLAKSQAECKLALDCLSALLVELGFTINVPKSVAPCQELVFLGICINTINL